MFRWPYAMCTFTWVCVCVCVCARTRIVSRARARHLRYSLYLVIKSSIYKYTHHSKQASNHRMNNRNWHVMYWEIAHLNIILHVAIKGALALAWASTFSIKICIFCFDISAKCQLNFRSNDINPNEQFHSRSLSLSVCLFSYWIIFYFF